MDTVGAQYGHVSCSSWGTVGGKSTVWAQYAKAQYGHSMGIVGARKILFISLPGDMAYTTLQ